MNVCDQEGIAEAVRIVDNYVKTVERGLDKICTRDKLDLFFSENYRTQHKNILLDFLKKCASVYALVISINDASLLALYSVTASALAQFLDDCLNDVLKQRKLSVPLKTTLDLRQSNNVMTWDLTVNEKNWIVKQGTTTVADFVSSFKAQIAAYESMRSATRNDIRRFVEQTPSLKEHLGEDYCQKRLDDIFFWLRNALTKHHLIVYIDVEEEPNLIRQLLCHPTLSVKSILSSLIKTDYFKKDPELPCFSKDIVSFKSLALPLSSKEIRIYADTFDIFWADGGNDKYARLIKEYFDGNEVDYLVDVNQAWHGGRIRTVSLLERSSHEKQTALYESFELIDEDIRLDAYVELQNNKVTAHVERTIKSSLASVPERLTYKGNYRTEHGTQATLTDLVLKSCTWNGGVKESCEVLQDCIDTTISKANTFVDERDLGSFNGDIVLSTHKMSANSFDMKRKLLWTPTVKSVMEDERNHPYVRECIEQRLRVNTLKLAYGDDEVSHCVIPPLMDRNHYTQNNIITNNTINDNRSKNMNKNVLLNVGLTTALLANQNQQVEVLPAATKKRKLPEEELLQERIKRIRLMKDIVHKGEDVYRLEKKEETNPRLDTFKECIVCELQKRYSSFYQPDKQKETNICVTCLRKAVTLRSSRSKVIQ